MVVVAGGTGVCGSAGLAGSLAGIAVLVGEVSSSWAVICAGAIGSNNIGTGVGTFSIEKELAIGAGHTIGGRVEAVETVGTARLAGAAVRVILVWATGHALAVAEESSSSTSDAVES